MQVHEHHIERRSLVACCQDLHRFGTIVGNGYDRSGALQQFRRNLLVHLVVFDQQNPDPQGVMHMGVVFLRAGTVALESGNAEQVHLS